MNSIIKFLLGLIGFVDESDELLCATFKFRNRSSSCDFTDAASRIMYEDIVGYDNCRVLSIWKGGYRIEPSDETCYATVWSFKKSAIAKAKAHYAEHYAGLMDVHAVRS